MKVDFSTTTNGQVGHGGTLDPFATGVVVIGVGAHCKKLTSFLNSEKVFQLATYNQEYIFKAKLGSETDTQDFTGSIISTKDFQHVTRSDIEKVIPRFTGEIQQIPPS